VTKRAGLPKGTQPTILANSTVLPVGSSATQRVVPTTTCSGWAKLYALLMDQVGINSQHLSTTKQDLTPTATSGDRHPAALGRLLPPPVGADLTGSPRHTRCNPADGPLLGMITNGWLLLISRCYCKTVKTASAVVVPPTTLFK